MAGWWDSVVEEVKHPQALNRGLTLGSQWLIDKAKPFVPPELRGKIQSAAEVANMINPATGYSNYVEAAKKGDYGDAALETIGLIPGEGVAAAAGKLAGISLTSRPLRAIAGYHGTTSPEDFSKFAPSHKDLGTHFTTNPNVANEYSLGRSSGLHNSLPPHMKAEFAPRTYPVVADINKAFKFPIDPGNWYDHETALNKLYEWADDSSVKLPKGILKDLEEAGSREGGWEDNFIPMLKDRGYDAVKYPHMETPNVFSNRYNSYMVFDENQIAPRFSPEGQEIIKKRGGIIRPYEKKLYYDPDELGYFDALLGAGKQE